MDFFQRLSQEVKIQLNEQQKQAATHWTGPALVLAGPGSGKTTVIISRLAYLMQEKGVDPANILSMTFNKAAAVEMEKRYERIFGKQQAKAVKFSTLHSFCFTIVRHYERMKNASLTLIEGKEGPDSKRSILKSIYREVNQSTLNDDEFDILQNELGFAKNKMMENLDEYKFNTQGFKQIFELYEKYKKSNRLIDFDDMLTYAYHILRKEASILEYYRNRYPFVQVDEGQDLSRIQFEIVKLFVGSSSNLFMVADDDQSIYGFRGAEPSYILNFREDFPGAALYYLENNYRSTRNIVELSSQLIKRNSQRYDKNHTTGNNIKYDPELIEVQDEVEQMRFLVKTIQKHQKEKNKYKEIAVLYRNNLSSILAADAFDRGNIRFSIKENKLYFFNHWFVLDVLAFLKFALNPADAGALERIYYKMNRYLSKTMMEHAAGVGGKNLLEAILTYEDLKPFQRRNIYELKDEFKRLSWMSPEKALQYIEKEFNYLECAKEYCDKTGNSFGNIKDMFTILKIISENTRTLPAFIFRLEDLDNMLNQPANSREKADVALSTLHSSKGLEFDCVFMIDLREGEFPGSKSLEAAQNDENGGLLEEERRLFYVGMTRARERLYLVHTQTKCEAKTERSSFIAELVECMEQRVARDITIGTIIQHRRYGKGVIVEIRERSGKSTMIEVDFNQERRLLDLTVCIEKKVIEI